MNKQSNASDFYTSFSGSNDITRTLIRKITIWAVFDAAVAPLASRG